MKFLLSIAILVLITCIAKAEVPPTTTTEAAERTRDINLKDRIEVLLSTGQNLSGNGFLRTNQVGVETQFHVNQKWAIDLGYSKVFNSFTSYADQYKSGQGVYPTTDQANSRIEARAQYHLFYGNVYFSDEKLVHFDQYIGFGVVRHELDSGVVFGPVLDVGIVSWVTRWITLHGGIKDYFYSEKNQPPGHTLNGYLLLGVLF